MVKKSLVLLFVVFLSGYWSARAQLCSQNPSFEGTPQAHVVPAPWDECGGSPDTQPGQWGITQPASDGSTYVSFLQSGSSPGGYYEGASQQLSSCMVAGTSYTISVDLAHSNVYNTAGPGDCYSSFIIYGGNSLCDEGEALGQVGPIMHTNWVSYTFTFTPTSNWCYITFRPYWITSCSGYINILVDNMSCVDLVTGVVAVTDVTCNGACDGTAVATPNSGTPPYTYSWAPGGQTTDSISGLCPGTYTVTITDSTGATTTADGIIIEPPALAVTITTTNVSCQGGNDGTAMASVTGGTTSYTYLWSTGATTSSISGLVSGSYSVTITDNNGCQVIGSTSIIDGGVVTASISAQINVSCFGGNDGSATVQVTDGVPAYTYLWSNGQNTNIATGLIAATYNCTITDSKGCTAVVSVTITEPPALTGLISSITNVTCNGVCDGQATVLASGGVSPYTYLWSNGQTTSTGTGFCMGTANVDVYDANACTTNVTVNIAEPAVLALSTTSIDPGCADSCNGSASVTASGGTMPYTYLWNDPSSQTTTTAANLCDSAHTITVTDSNACIAVATVVLTDPPVFVASIASTVDVDCNSNCTGYAMATTAGGGAPYTYLWTNGDSTDQATSLCQGSYTVTITNTNGCVSSATATINEPPLLSVSVSSTNVTCADSCDGSATATPSGGIGSYTYLWDDALLQSTQTASNLCSAPGGVLYTVLVTDSNGCVSSDNDLITQPTPLNLAQSVISPTTCSSNNGSACVNALGGIAPYTIVWNDSSSTVDSCITNVYAGAYNATATDAMGCVYSIPVVINDISGPTIDSITVSKLNCFGDNNGTAILTISGGTAPFTYTWYDNAGNIIATGSTLIFNLTAQIYSVEVTDGNFCTVADTFQLIEPPLLVSAITGFSNVTCNGACDGTASVLVNGGTTPYTYAWSNGQSSTLDTAMCAATHNVQIIDSAGCTDIQTITITEPLPLIVTIAVTDVSCNGFSDGSICLTPAGGSVPYTYQWLAGGSASCLSGITATTYTVIISDNNGCFRTENILVTEPPVLNANGMGSPSTCGDANGQAEALPSGGIAPYTYSWDDIGLQSTKIATGLLEGFYNVTITDDNGCIVVVNNVSVGNIAGPDIDSIIGSDVTCGGTATGTATVYPSGGSGSYTYLWNDPSAQTTQTAVNLLAGPISVTVTDVNSCDSIEVVTIIEPAPLVATTIASTICYGQTETIEVVHSGGTGPYSYLWNNNATTSSQTVSPLTTTTYQVIVTDTNGCTDIISDSVNVTPPISVTMQSTEICEGASTILSPTTVAGGGGLPSYPYTYTWNNSQTTSSITVNPTITTTYSLTVDDGCSNDTTVSVNVTVNPLPDVGFIWDCSNLYYVHFEDTSSVSTGSITSYSWDFGDPNSGANNTSSIQSPDHDFSDGFLGSANVSLIATTNFGCADTATDWVQGPPTANFSLWPTETTTLNPFINMLDNSYSVFSNVVSWSWDFGDGITAGPGAGAITSSVKNTNGNYDSLIHEYEDTTGVFFVVLTVTNAYGCIDTMRLPVDIKSDFILFAPNAFSPASFFPKNRYFKPSIIGAENQEIDLYIFDRWGDKIYEYTGTYSKEWLGWDGVANKGKKEAQSDVYVWLIRVTDLNDKDHEFFGHVTLLR